MDDDLTRQREIDAMLTRVRRELARVGEVPTAEMETANDVDTAPAPSPPRPLSRAGVRAVLVRAVRFAKRFTG